MGKSEFEEVTAIIGGFFRCLGCWNDTENKEHKATKGLLLHVVFDDGKDCIYDVNDDINTIKGYEEKEVIELHSGRDYLIYML
ncbi:MAG: hypothetical protein ACI4SA_09230, partial [Lachnospiraceae bacterium]